MLHKSEERPPQRPGRPSTDRRQALRSERQKGSAENSPPPGSFRKALQLAAPIRCSPFPSSPTRTARRGSLRYSVLLPACGGAGSQRVVFFCRRKRPNGDPLLRLPRSTCRQTRLRRIHLRARRKRPLRWRNERRARPRARGTRHRRAASSSATPTSWAVGQEGARGLPMFPKANRREQKSGDGNVLGRRRRTLNDGGALKSLCDARGRVVTAISDNYFG